MRKLIVNLLSSCGVDFKNNFGNPSETIRDAIPYGLPIVKICLHIPDLNAGDGMKTGIYKAVEKGDYEMIKFLTSKVKDPSTAQHVSFIPIHIAAYLGHTAIVELLAGFYDNPKDANSMCSHFNTTPMKEVKTYEHFDIVELSHKFDPEDFQRLYGKEVPTTDDDNLEEEKPEFI